MDTLKIYNVKWTSHSAGPSLINNNARTEIFLAGCNKAISGKPCKGCFNDGLWKRTNYFENTIEQVFNNIKRFAPTKYLTFVGGEPLDQLTPLAELCALLHEDGYNIIVITHFSFMNDIAPAANTNPDMYKLIHNVDAIVDGEYIEDIRIWDDDKAGDGLHDVIGSGNQIIWEIFDDSADGVVSSNIVSWAMNINKEFVYVYKDGLVPSYPVIHYTFSSGGKKNHSAA